MVDTVTALWAGVPGRRAALRPKGTSGTPLLETHAFAAGKGQVHLRVAHTHAYPRLQREAWALNHLQGLDLVPRLVLAPSPQPDILDGRPHHLLLLPGVLSAVTPNAAHWRAVGTALGRLHACSGVAVRLRAPVLGHTSLMASFQALSDQVKQYLARRESDGLPQDLLTLSLSDLMRALRRYVAAAEHHFIPPPGRVLCHGLPEPGRLLMAKDTGTIVMTGLEHAHAGDGSADLAIVAEEAGLDDTMVSALLAAYAEARGRKDARLVPRMCARRVLHRLQRAVDALRELQLMADAVETGLGPYAAALVGWLEEARRRVMHAFNGLVDFTGPARPLSLAEVEAMGAPLAVEELHLRGEHPVLGLEGPPYVGKTPLAQELARRLKVPYLGLAAAARAAAWATGTPGGVEAQDVADMLGRLTPDVSDGVVRLMWDGQDALEYARTAGGTTRLAPHVLDDPRVCTAMQNVVAKLAPHGLVVEGPSMEGVLPAGSHRFVVWASAAVRHARAVAHRASLPEEARAASTPPSLPELTAGTELPPAPPEGATLVNATQASLPQLMRTVLRALVPAALVPSDTGLTGRPVLFA